MVSFTALAGELPRIAVRRAAACLADAGCDDAAFDAAWLCRLATGRDPRLDPHPLTAAQAEQLTQTVARRCRREPLQYIAGSWQFIGSELAVGPGVLIPRADTECVCETAAGFLKRSREKRAVDLCSGSGCIALGLAELVPGARITAVELSEEAFPYLAQNAAQAPAVTPVKADALLFPKTLTAGSVDVFVSNPPYLTGDEMKALQPEVAFEPAMALYGGQDGLDFYRALAPVCLPVLAAGGALVFEVGWQQADAVSALLKQAGYVDVGTVCDACGIRRCVFGTKPQKEQ